MPTANPFAKTEAARRWISRYNWSTEFEDKEPTTITLHECTMHYGGPEEGGWYWESGWPIKTVCIFSKKQAIREAIELEEYALKTIGDKKDNLGWPQWCVSFSNEYAKAYPEERPYYC